MKTSFLATAALASALAASPAMAQDFHALSKMFAAPVALQDGDLASIEGGGYWGGFGGIRQSSVIKQFNFGGGFAVQTNSVSVIQIAWSGW